MKKKLVPELIDFNESLGATNSKLQLLLKCSKSSIESAKRGTRGWPSQTSDLALALESAIGKAEQMAQKRKRPDTQWTNLDDAKLRKLTKTTALQLANAKSKYENMKSRYEKAIHAQYIISILDLNDIPEADRKHTALWLERQRVFIEVKKIRNGPQEMVKLYLAVVGLEAKLQFLNSMKPDKR
jgi:hypothetical protein